METRHKYDAISEIWSPDETQRLMRGIWLRHRANFGPSKLRKPKRRSYPKTGHEVVDELAAACVHYSDGDLHWGLTSSDIVDNVRIRQVDGSNSVIQKLGEAALQELDGFILSAKGINCLGRTHLLPAVPVDMGARFYHLRESIDRLLGVRPMARYKPLAGPVGQEHFGPPFLYVKIQSHCNQTTDGETYLDSLAWLADLSARFYKLAQDLRTLIGYGEIEVVGGVSSSAMPHKSNPALLERVCSLALRQPHFYNQAWLAISTSVLERTLTDSALIRNTLEEAYQNAARQIEDTRTYLPTLRFNLRNIRHNLRGNKTTSTKELETNSKTLSRIDAYFLTRSNYQGDAKSRARQNRRGRTGR